MISGGNSLLLAVTCVACLLALLSVTWQSQRCPGSASSTMAGAEASGGPPFVLAISGTLKPGLRPKFIELFTPLAEYVAREEPGTLAYQLSLGEDEDSLYIFERYVNKAYLEDVHWKSKPFLDFKAAVAAAGIEWVKKDSGKYLETTIGYMHRSSTSSSS